MIALGYRMNFATLQKASDDGALVLMEATEVATGNPAILICAVKAAEDKEQVEMVPLARMIDGNPYELFIPPQG